MINDQANIRLDNYVLNNIEGISRSMASKIIDMGLVKVNGEVNTKSSYKVKENDEVDISYDNKDFSPKNELIIQIIYEDEDVIIIDKPMGVLTHAKGNFNTEDTVETWVKPKLKEYVGARAGIVHRLDRATSGVMILAKNEKAAKKIAKQFSNRTIKKTYIAVINGTLKEDKAIIDMPIERNPKKPQTFKVSPNGKHAYTEYSVIKHNGKYSLIELKPKTGRTHQLRVHMAHIGHPIAGDPVYSDKILDRMYLHAHEIEFTLPKGERKIFTSKVPSSFNDLVK